MTRGTHSPVEQLPGIGDAVGRYRIVGVLGDGDLGKLYLAEQRGIRGVSKTVALRCIRPELAQSPHFGARFSEAANLATRCQHPNLVTVFEMGHVDGRYFISMEYLPAESLTSVLGKCNSRGDLSPDIAAYVVKQAAAAAQYLLDQRKAAPWRVSPRTDLVDTSNLFVSYHGTVKWLGLGLRSLLDARGDGDTGAISGAPASTTLAADADRSPEVMSLGAVLWTCLIGESPQPIGVDADEVTPNVSSTPGGVRTDVPEALEAIVKQALFAPSRERFANPRALADALDRYLARREARPTPKQLRRSMEQWFGPERAALQMQIARGRDVEAALTRLHATAQPGRGPSHGVRPVSAPRPRALWSTSHAVFAQLSRASIAPRSFERFVGSLPDDSSHVTTILTRHLPSTFVTAPPGLANAELPALEPPKQAPPSRSWLVTTVLAAGAVLAVGLVVILSLSSPQGTPGLAGPDSASSAHGGRLDVRSTPEGAAVFVDGEPTGLHTPALLKGLAQGRTLRVRVEKAGFASQERQFSVTSVAGETALFELQPSDARVRFEGVPPAARLFVDDVPFSAGRDHPVNLSVGSHLVRVETANELLFSDRVKIGAGEQTIHLPIERANP